MTAEEKLARHRLNVLELAEAIGNVSEACRRRGMTRTDFYEWRRRFQTQGIEGLRDLPPIHKTHPQTTSAKVVEKLLALSLEHPAWGCYRLSDMLALQGISVSGPTIQGILAKHGMATRYDRLLKLEERQAKEPIEPTPEQVRLIEKSNPCFRERHVESSKRGELLCQDLFYVGHLKGVGKVYLDSVMDTYNSFAFGFPHTGKLPSAAVAPLHNEVIPFYEERGLKVEAVLTDNGREYCGTDAHPYELYLALYDVEHRKTKVRHPYTNGFVERFHRTVLDEFFRTAFRTKVYSSVEELQTDLDVWLRHYNYDRPHQGYRNLGKRPIDAINQYLASSTDASRYG